MRRHRTEAPVAHPAKCPPHPGLLWSALVGGTVERGQIVNPGPDPGCRVVDELVFAGHCQRSWFTDAVRHARLRHLLPRIRAGLTCPQTRRQKSRGCGASTGSAAGGDTLALPLEAFCQPTDSFSHLLIGVGAHQPPQQVGCIAVVQRQYRASVVRSDVEIGRSR